MDLIAEPTFQPTSEDNPAQGKLQARPSGPAKHPVPIPKEIRPPTADHHHHNHHGNDENSHSRDNDCEPGSAPIRKILTPEDLHAFQHAPVHAELMGVLDGLNEAVKNLTLDAPCHESKVSFLENNRAFLLYLQLTEHLPNKKTLREIMGAISAIGDLADATPLVEQGKSRFGNVAFQHFYDQAGAMIPSLISAFVPTLHVREIGTYLQESFGSRKRIDYGTGHELNFIAFL